jgi:hypothetical protein
MTTRLIRYPEERALEDAAYRLGVIPTRIFALLLPVWCVEIEATVTDGEPYELIDRYLGRAIAEGGLRTTADLARFLALDEVLVDRALRFLAAIGHITVTQGRIALTDLGRLSVQEKIRYVITRKDRRKLYFDAFGSRPLTRPYYDSRTVTFLSGAALREATERNSGPRFGPLTSTYGFRSGALTELVERTDRDHYNMPEGIDNPKQLGSPECVHLPTYVIRAIERNSGEAYVHYLAYTQAADEADVDIGDLIQQTPEVVSAIEQAERDSRTRQDETARATAWLADRSLGKYRPEQTADGMWRITVPGSAFDGKGPLPISKLGSFVILGTDFFHVWCTDKRVRRRAMLERADAYLSSRRHVDPAVAGERVGQIAQQLELGTIDLPALQTMAAKAGKRDLAAQLARLVR